MNANALYSMYLKHFPPMLFYLIEIIAFPLPTRFFVSVLVSPGQDLL